MRYTVYILHSEKSGVFYKGYTSNLEKRLWQHNNGLGRFTKDKGPWELVFSKEFEFKKEALIFERKIKRLGSEALERLILNQEDKANPGSDG